MGFQKPNNLHYRNLMDEHGASLVNSEHSEEINSLVKLQRFVEKIRDLHTAKQPSGDPQTEALDAEVNIQVFLNELEQWRMTTTELTKNLR